MRRVDENAAEEGPGAVQIEGQRKQSFGNDEFRDEKTAYRVNTRDGDKALKVLELEGDRQYVVDGKTSDRIKHRLDLCLMPLMYITYFLQYLDKTTLSYASVMGLQKDTNLVGNQYNWLGTVFYFGYLVAEPLGNRCLQYFPLGRFIAVNMIIWGIILACTAACHNFASLAAIRVLLGFFEASISPGFILLTAQYYRMREQAGRMGIWWSANGLSQTLGGCLAYGIAVSSAGARLAITSWQILFLCTGVVTSLWGILLYFLLPNDPLSAWFLSPDDRILAVERIRMNQQGVGNRHFKKAQCIEALKDPLTWCYFFYIMVSSIPQGALTSFFAIVINNFGFTPTQTLLYSSPSGVFFLGAVLIFTFFADRIGQRILVIIGTLLISVLGGILVIALPAENKIGRLFGYYLTQTNAAPAILMLSLTGTNTAGYTKKVTTTALTFIGYAAGFIIGPQTFQASQAPQYVPAKICICVFWGVNIAIVIAIRVIYVYRNKQKKKIREQPGYQKLANSEFMDLTDRNNPEFVYTL